MSGEILSVNTDVLRSAGTTFGQVGDQIAVIQADAPIGEAAASVPKLETAAACYKVQAYVAAALAEASRSARIYGGNLATVAGWYEARDEASGAAIRAIKFPDPMPSSAVEAAVLPGNDDAEPYAVDQTAAAVQPTGGPNLIYCYEVSGPDPFLCEGYNGNGPYTFPSPIDVSGVG